MSSEVAALARAGLRNPRLVTVNVETHQKKLQASLGIIRDAYMNIDIDACIDAWVCGYRYGSDVAGAGEASSMTQ